MSRPVGLHDQSPNVSKTAGNQDPGAIAKSETAGNNDPGVTAKSETSSPTLLPGVCDHLKDKPDLIFAHKEPKLESWMLPNGGELILHSWMPLPSSGTHPLSLDPARPTDPIKDPARPSHPIKNPGMALNYSFCGYPEGAVMFGPTEVTDRIQVIIPPSTTSVTELRWRIPK